MATTIDVAGRQARAAASSQRIKDLVEDLRLEREMRDRGVTEDVDAGRPQRAVARDWGISGSQVHRILAEGG
jgi:FixJ family two-component response regulator